MYYVNDFAHDCYYTFNSKEELVLWWRGGRGDPNKSIGYYADSGRKPIFNELNVTGKDIYIRDYFCGYKDVDGVQIPIYKEETFLRRFQVLDEHLRSIDIREWDDSVWQYSPPIRRYYWHYSGAKDHTRRAHGASFYRRTKQLEQCKIDFDELAESGLPLPMRLGVDVRRGLISSDRWAHYEKVHHNRYSSSKCWKDQCKAESQWGRHSRKNCA